VHINNLDNIPQEYSLKVPRWCEDSADSYRIHYSSIQSLTNEEERNPVSICYIKYSGEPRRSLTEVERAFRHYRRAWLKSDTCMWLTHHFASATSAVRLNKIVCFGLGPLGQTDNQSAARSHTQHAAIETVARVLKGKGACDICCYAQDPAYDDVERKFFGTSALQSSMTLEDFWRLIAILSFSPLVLMSL
jgi:hypothetical protein